MNHEKEVVNATVVGNAQLNTQLPNGRSISFSFYLIDGESEKDLNKRIDTYQAVMERQRVKYEIPELETKLNQLLDHKKQILMLKGDLDAKKTGGKSLNSSEKQNYDNYPVTLNRIDEEIAKAKDAIAKAKEESK